MKKIISENGSVSIFVIIAFIFCITILLGIYWANTNYQIMTLQAETQIKESYEKDVNRVEEIHAELTKEE